MKDFRLDRKAEPKYILDVKTQTTRETVGEEVHDVETYSVKFADGRVFKNILVDDANLQKIIAQQEKQAKRKSNSACACCKNTTPPRISFCKPKRRLRKRKPLNG